MSVITVERASDANMPLVSAVLLDAAGWLEGRGEPLWALEELVPEKLRLEPGDYWLARVEGVSGGCMRFQLEDPQHWPDVPADESAFIHRLAVRRSFSGGGVSKALLEWAKQHARSLGRAYLRLDCEAKRAGLCRFYESSGFVKHSERQVGAYHIARYEYPLQPLD